MILHSPKNDEKPASKPRGINKHQRGRTFLVARFEKLGSLYIASSERALPSMASKFLRHFLLMLLLLLLLVAGELQAARVEKLAFHKLPRSKRYPPPGPSDSTSPHKVKLLEVRKLPRSVHTCPAGPSH